jgi:hypothetical protein
VRYQSCRTEFRLRPQLRFPGATGSILRALVGVGATGIGAFYDDEVHRYLNLTPERGQVVYHFAIGYPVPDPRLQA